jgi:hypothetical protein
LGTYSSTWSKAQLSSTPPESLLSKEAAMSAKLEEESAMMLEKEGKVKPGAR